jgi:pSer/pThr/pTyr-binding forkhead associated (FHA) protein/predicted negative regulator of RcsB-dependent stress response
VAVLKIKDDEGERVVPLDRPLMTLGRSKENEIRIASTHISRRHCQIEKVDQGFKLVDLESRNGTRVNDKFVNQHVLAHGDKVVIGDVVLKFEDPEAGATALTAPVRSPEEMRRIAEAQMREAAAREQAAPAVHRRTTLAARRRQGSPGGLIFAGIVVLALGAAGWFIFNRMQDGADAEAERLYREAERLQSSDPALALEKLNRIKPTASKWHAMAQALKPSVNANLHASRVEAGGRFEKDLQELSTFIAKYPGNGQEILARLDRFESAHGDTLDPELKAWIEAERRKAKLALGARSNRGLETALRKIEPLVAQHRFTDALTEIKSARDGAGSPEGAREFDDVINGLVNDALKYFDEEDARGQALLKEGKKEEADDLYTALRTCFVGTVEHPEFNDIVKAIKARQKAQ